jgi:hypothetical protein
MTLLHATRFILLVSLILVKSAIVFSWDCSINLQKFTIKDSSLVNGVARNRGIQVTLPGSQIVGLRFSWYGSQDSAMVHWLT